MMFDQVMQANPQGDSLHLLEYTLNVTKGNKNPAHQKIQVLLLPGESQQVLALRVDSLVPTADTAIARTVTDPATWKDFSIGSVSSFLNRLILITHSGVSGSLQDSITKSDTWRGQFYSGPWRIFLPLSSEEKSNRTLIPSRILLKVSIIKTKQ